MLFRQNLLLTSHAASGERNDPTRNLVALSHSPLLGVFSHYDSLPNFSIAIVKTSQRIKARRSPVQLFTFFMVELHFS